MFNEYNDWFPEGEDSWGNSSISSNKQQTSEEIKQYKTQEEENYKQWLLVPKSKKTLSFLFIVRAINENKL